LVIIFNCTIFICNQKKKKRHYLFIFKPILFLKRCVQLHLPLSFHSRVFQIHISTTTTLPTTQQCTLPRNDSISHHPPQFLVSPFNFSSTKVQFLFSFSHLAMTLSNLLLIGIKKCTLLSSIESIPLRFKTSSLFRRR